MSDVAARRSGHAGARRLHTHAELVYSHRPIEELADIVDTARSIGAKAV